MTEVKGFSHLSLSAQNCLKFGVGVLDNLDGIKKKRRDRLTCDRNLYDVFIAILGLFYDIFVVLG
jgi:hypothetical protein